MQNKINKIKNKIQEHKAQKLQNSKASSGFTLVEIMVSVSIFALVMVIAIGAVLAIVSANKKAQALNSVITNLNFAVEGMMRDLRTGYNYDCGTPGDGVTSCPNGALDDSQISFHSAQSNATVTYGQVGSKIYKKIDTGENLALTSDDITIDAMHFYVVDAAPASSGNYGQPRILIIIRGKFNGYGGLTDFNLQTMVSQRKLDI